MSFEKLDLKAALHICENIRAADIECLEALIGDFRCEAFAINRWQTMGAAWAFYQNGIPVVMGGIAESTPWSACAWMVSSIGVSGDSWKKIIRFSRKVFGNAAIRYRRIDAQCIETWPQAALYAEKVGFKHVNTRENAGRDGQSVLEFAIIGSNQ